MDVRIEYLKNGTAGILSAYCCLACLVGDRQDKSKTSAPRDMLHLHYYLSLISQEYAGVGVDSGSACYGDSQHGPVTADGALERSLGSNGCVACSLQLPMRILPGADRLKQTHRPAIPNGKRRPCCIAD